MQSESDKKTLNFPPGFLWGATTAAHQVEGNNTHNDWWEFEQAGGGLEKSGLACDHYHLYGQDFDLAKELGQNAHRFSIEWSRIEPEEGVFNEKEIEHYRNVLRALKERNIKTMVTLFHFTLPSWLSKMGGFTNTKSVFYFERFSQRVFKEYCDLVDFWIILNEPLVYSFFMTAILERELTFSPLGMYPPPFRPSLQSLWRLPRLVKNMISAHKKVYEFFHKNSDARVQVGISHHYVYFEPYNPNLLLDNLTIGFFDYLWNHFFLNQIQKQLDFIGLNYYIHYRLQFLPWVRNENKKVSDLGWEIFPEGIFRGLTDLKKYRLPLYVTENGLADNKDQFRESFIRDHLSWVWRAIKDGADVRGYFHWSLLDNFEWEKGFFPRFGLAEVDYKTQERKIRPSARTYAQICRDNGFTFN